MTKKMFAVFFALVATFVTATAMIFVPTQIAMRELFPLVIALAISSSFLGLASIILAVKSNTNRTQKKFIILTGASALAFPITSILHNLFYGIGIFFANIRALQLFTEVLHTSFFIISIIVCPICFLIGASGSIFLQIKHRNKVS